MTDSTSAPPELTAAERDIMRHTLGLNHSGESYRNFFDAGEAPTEVKPGHGDWGVLVGLEARGLMARSRTPGFMPPGTVVFHVTEAGKACDLSLPPGPKLTRSQARYKRWLDVGDCFRSFREFLIYETAREKQARAGGAQ